MTGINVQNSSSESKVKSSSHPGTPEYSGNTAPFIPSFIERLSGSLTGRTKKNSQERKGGHKSPSPSPVTVTPSDARKEIPTALTPGTEGASLSGTPDTPKSTRASPFRSAGASPPSWGPPPSHPGSSSVTSPSPPRPLRSLPRGSLHQYPFPLSTSPPPLSPPPPPPSSFQHDSHASFESRTTSSSSLGKRRSDLSDDSMDSIALKRRRTDSKNPTGPVTQRHFYEDGDVIICVQGTDVRFKLHETRLTQVSAWFRAKIMEKRSTKPSLDQTEVQPLRSIVVDDIKLKDFRVFLDFLYADMVQRTAAYQPDLKFLDLEKLYRASEALKVDFWPSDAIELLGDMWKNAYRPSERVHSEIAAKSVSIYRRQGKSEQEISGAIYELLRKGDYKKYVASSEREKYRGDYCFTGEDLHVLTKATQLLSKIWMENPIPPRRRQKCNISWCLYYKHKVRGKKEPIGSNLFFKYYNDPIFGMEVFLYGFGKTCRGCSEAQKERYEEMKKRVLGELGQLLAGARSAIH